MTLMQLIEISRAVGIDTAVLEVVAYMFSIAEPETGYIYGTVREFGELVGASESSAKKAVKWLKDNGYVNRVSKNCLQINQEKVGYMTKGVGENLYPDGMILG